MNRKMAKVWMISSGAGALFYAAPLSPSIVITVGLPPTATPASVITEA